jgi:hypothetical protein
MKQDITTSNTKGKLHGYQERYDGDKLGTRTFWKNGVRIAYHEWHHKNFKATRYFIK